MAMGAPELILILMAVGVGLFGTAFWIWMLIDCATKEPSEGNERLVWIIIVVFTHIIGAAIYFVVRRPQRITQLGR
jgi:hypothetical protein